MAIFVSNHESEAQPLENPVSEIVSAGPAACAGLAGIPAGPVESDSDQKPPITNRGADITIPLENRFLLDWVAFTVKLDDPNEVLGIIGLPTSLFTDTTIGFSGYRRSLRFGNICVYYQGREGMGCHVEMSGQGCRQYEGQFTGNPWPALFLAVLAAGGKFTRLDFAIDNVDGALSLSRLFDSIHEGQTRTLFSEWRRIVKGEFRVAGCIAGETIYLGSSKSQVMFRVYDKAQESGVAGHWIRFEIQLRDKRANEAARLFDVDGNVGLLATGIINNYFAVVNNDDSNISRCSLQPWWSAWLESTEKISLATEKAVKLVSETMEYIKRQYAPTFAMIKKHLGGSTFDEFVQDVLEDGNQRMTVKHEQILAASAAGTSMKGGGNGP